MDLFSPKERDAVEDKYGDTPSTRASKRMLDAAGVRYYQYQPTGRTVTLAL